MRKKQFRHMGLSPQARGKLLDVVVVHIPVGPIPAGTGETYSVNCTLSCIKAYPRRHGGNLDPSVATDRPKGLSPQARGKPKAEPSILSRRGPIPAGTGETQSGKNLPEFDRAYPRRHGGNPSFFRDHIIRQGLSPQARGKHALRGCGCLSRGPIPAGTGETGSPRYRRSCGWAYPRRHGGNSRR